MFNIYLENIIMHEYIHAKNIEKKQIVTKNQMLKEENDKLKMGLQIEKYTNEKLK